MPTNKLIPREHLKSMEFSLMEYSLFFSLNNIKRGINEIISKHAAGNESLQKDLEALLSDVSKQEKEYSNNFELIIKHFNKFIYNPDQDTINEYKVFIYNMLKNTEVGTEQNKYLYEMYQNLKKGEMTIDDIRDSILDFSSVILKEEN